MSARPKPIISIFLVAALTLIVATIAAAADPVVHTVQKGETLYSIAKRYDVAVDAVMKANSIADPGRLFVGLKLTIPAQAGAVAPSAPAASAATTVEYVVKKGDTLYSIAKAHGASVDSIVKSSGMSSTTIKAGQKLAIPVSGVSVVSTKPASTAASTVSAATAVATATVASKPAVRAASDPSSSWPATGQVSYLQGKLKGVSIAAGPASPVQAIRSGTVISAGPFRGFGQVAFVQASDGLVYVYGGADILSVRVGDAIRKGSVIGKLSQEKDAVAYFFVFKGADTLDPNSVPRD